MIIVSVVFVVSFCRNLPIICNIIYLLSTLASYREIVICVQTAFHDMRYLCLQVSAKL